MAGQRESKNKKAEAGEFLGPHLLDEYPSMSTTARNWMSAAPKEQWVKDYFDFLNRQLCSLELRQRQEMVRRIVASSDNKFHEAIAELVYVALWNHLKWPFNKDYQIAGQKPDFRVSFRGPQASFFYSDVTVVRHNHPQRPHKVELDGRGKIAKLPVVTEPIQQAHRFIMKIKDKFKRYSSKIGEIPFLVCFFQSGFEDCFYLDDFQIQSALFGDLKLDFDTGELRYEPSIQNTAHDTRTHGVFGFEEYKSLTAVIACKEEFYASRGIGCRDERQGYHKPRFGFTVYSNPLGVWAASGINPFCTEGFPPNGLSDGDTVRFCGAKMVEFW